MAAPWMQLASSDAAGAGAGAVFGRVAGTGSLFDEFVVKKLTFLFYSGVESMAGGWARDGAVQDQIDASIQDELKRMRARRSPEGASQTNCAECDEPIPEARQRAIPGVKLCIDCRNERDARPAIRGGINRRGSKDSQLK